MEFWRFLVSYRPLARAYDTSSAESSRQRDSIGGRASCNTCDTYARGYGYFWLLREQYHYKPPKASQGAAALPGAHAASASPQSEV